LRYLWGNLPLRTIAWIAAVINGVWGAWATVFLLHAVTPGPLGLSEPRYGALLALSAIGGLVGTVLAVPLLRRIGQRWAIGINILCNLTLCLVPALTTSVPLIGLAIVFGEVGGPIWGIAVMSLQQRSVPDELRGRVSAAYRVIGFGAAAVGPLLGGLTLALVGSRAAFVIFAGAVALTFVPFILVLRERALQPLDAPAA
jgi:MFS family permease